MNANSVNHIKNSQILNHLETASYSVLAIGLIGHVFYLDSQFSAINVALLFSGIVCGMMAVVAWTPVTARFSAPVTFNLAEVLSFSKEQSPDTSHDSDDRRAA